MPVSRANAQTRGSIGGLMRAALAPDRPSITREARAARWQKYVDQVREALPDLVDQAEINRRAELLRTADMKRLALRAATARSAAAKARRAAQDLAEAIDAQPA